MTIDYAKEYAESVINGDRIAGKKVILSAKRYLNDLKASENDDFPYFYDVERANRVNGLSCLTCTGGGIKMTPANGAFAKLCCQWHVRMVNLSLSLVSRCMSF